MSALIQVSGRKFIEVGQKVSLPLSHTLFVMQGLPMMRIEKWNPAQLIALELIRKLITLCFFHVHVAHLSSEFSSCVDIMEVA